MKKINYYSIIGLVAMCFVTSCSSSDDSDGGLPEITDSSILTGDVNAPDFWDDDNLVWSDEFDGNSLSADKWFPQKFLGGQGNTELQNYTGNDNLEVSNGTLKIKVAQTGAGQSLGDYTSGRLDSKFVFTYGRVEMRAKLPAENGNGLWVKLWLLGSNFEDVGFPASGVIDIMNYVSHVPDQFFSSALVASGSSAPTTSNPVVLETAESQFHNYGILWTDEYIKFYVDDINNVTFTYLRPTNATDSNWPFDKSFYTQMEIDYVRVYHGKK